jgi:ABC-type sulfate transport system permease component
MTVHGWQWLFMTPTAVVLLSLRRHFFSASQAQDLGSALPKSVAVLCLLLVFGFPSCKWSLCGKSGIKLASSHKSSQIYGQS